MSAVYGGAIHPTAEGHAAMADATLPTMRSVLGLQPVEAPVRFGAAAAGQRQRAAAGRAVSRGRPQGPPLRRHEIMPERAPIARRRRA